MTRTRILVRSSRALRLMALAGVTSVGALTPLALAALVALPAPAAAQVARPSDLKYPPLPDFTVPKPTRFVLPNGMVVLVMEDHELPLVNITARLRTGTLLDPKDKAGLGALAGDLVRAGGTTTMKPDALDDFLEGRAASISTGVGADSGTASMSALKADVPEVLKLFVDVLRRPAFDADRVKIAVNEANAAISRQNDDPSGIRGREFAQVIYGDDSPFGRDETYASIAAITRDDLVAWHAKYFHPNRMILGIVGDITVPEAKALVEKAFGDWPKGPAVTEQMPSPRTTANPGVFEVVKDDSTQAFISVGHQGSLLRTNPDFYAVEVMNEVFGGGFSGRLMANVRTAKGLAYSVSGGVGAGWTRVSPFSMAMSTKAETTVAGVEAMMTEAKELQTTRPPTDAEVALAKSSILNSFIFNSDSRAEVLGQQMTFEYYGQPVDWLDRYRAGIEKVTTAQVAAAAKKYIHPEQFSIVVVAPEKGRDKPLSTLGKVAKLDIEIPEPAETGGGSAAGAGAAAGAAAGAGAAAAGAAAKTPASPEAAKKGRALLEKAVTAFGGAALVDKVTSYRDSGSMLVKSPQGEMEIKATMLVAPPDKVRLVYHLPVGEVTMVVSSGAAFMQTPKGQQPLPPRERARLEKDAKRVPLLLLRHRAAAGFSATALGPGKLGDLAVEQVAVEFGGEKSTWSIDPATGRVVGQTYRGEGPTGVPGEIVERYDDFRTVDGASLPFKTSTTYNGEPGPSAIVESIELNKPVDAALFDAPKAAAGKP